MATIQTEQEIIRCFIAKQRQERLLWELSNPKKRMQFFWHLAGTGEMKPECVSAFEYISARHLENNLLRLGGTNCAYYIGGSFIGPLSLQKAITRAEQGDICLIYCGNGIGYHQGEYNAGKPVRNLLIEK